MTESKRYIIKNNKTTSKTYIDTSINYTYKGLEVKQCNFLECTAWSPSVYIYCNDNVKGWVYVDELKEVK